MTLNERIGGFDADSNRIAGAHDGRPAGARHRLSRRHRLERQEPRQAADPRLARLRRTGHPLHLAHRSRSAPASTTANGNHNNHVMWRYGTGLLPATAAQVAAVTVQSLVTMDAWLSKLLETAPKETLELGAHAAAGRRRQAGWRGRPVLPDGRHVVHDARSSTRPPATPTPVSPSMRRRARWRAGRSRRTS